MMLNVGWMTRLLALKGVAPDLESRMLALCTEEGACDDADHGDALRYES